MAKRRYILKSREVVLVLIIFQDSSAIQFESSRREDFIDVAEHRSILKNNGTVRILIIFQDKRMFSHINGKLPPSPFK